MDEQRPWLLGSLIGVLAMFVASTFSTWLPVSMISLAAVLIVIQRERWRRHDGSTRQSRVWPRWQRWLLMILSLTVVTAVSLAWRMGDYLGESINPILVAIDVFSHAAIVMSWLLWTVRPRQGHVAMLLFGLLVVLLGVAAGGTSRTIAVQTTVASAVCIGFLVASHVILRRRESGVPIRSVEAGSDQPPTRRLATLFSLFALSLMLMATSAIAKVTNDVLPEIQESLYERLKSTLDSVDSESIIGGTRYVTGSDLGSIRKHILGDPEEVALRIHADRPPGYLRGTIFDVYSRSRWYTASEDLRERPAAMDQRTVRSSGRGSISLRSRSGAAPERYALFPRRDEPLITLEIENDPIKGNLVFLPLATRAVESRGRNLSVTHHGIVRNGIDTRFPYVALVGSGMRPEVIDPEVEPYLLQVPAEILPVTEPISRSITDPQSTTREKAEAISRYFRSEYSYSLNPTPSPESLDPIVHFLQSKHPAHCEFFATASLLLLRSVGVPARYVTGYVATEYSDENSYWLARNRDAHAWVEAYDDASGVWFAVESTPGRTYQTVDPNETEQGIDLDSLSGNDLTNRDDETMMGQTFGWLLSMRATDPLVIIFQFARWPLFLVLIFLLWWRFWRSPDGVMEAGELQSRRMLRSADRICRKYQLVRHPHETLHDFAARIEAWLGGPERTDPGPELTRESRRPPKSAATVHQLGALAQWYRDFANARYQNQRPVAFQTVWQDSRNRIASDQF